MSTVECHLAQCVHACDALRVVGLSSFEQHGDRIILITEWEKGAKESNRKQKDSKHSWSKISPSVAREALDCMCEVTDLHLEFYPRGVTDDAVKLNTPSRCVVKEPSRDGQSCVEN